MGAGGGERRGLLDIIARVDSSATYSFSYTYCIKSRLILYIPGQQADIGRLRVQMAFEILHQKIKFGKVYEIEIQMKLGNASFLRRSCLKRWLFLTAFSINGNSSILFRCVREAI